MDFHRGLDSYFSRNKQGHINFKEYLESCIDNQDYIIQVALNGDQVIGHIIAQKMERPPVFERIRYCVITDIVVVKEFQGKGLGQKLLNGIIDWARKNDLNRIELEVVPINKQAYSFYKQNGFRDYLHKLFLEV